MIDCSIQQTKLISSRDNGPGIDTGDILCEGYLTRAALLPPATPQSNPWDWLAAEQAWQTPACGPPSSRRGAMPRDPARPATVQVPAEGVCWLGDLALLQTPGVLPLSRGAPVCWRQPADDRPGLRTRWHRPAGAAGAGGGDQLCAQAQPRAGARDGDSLNLIAERYGTTVATLRRINPQLESTQTITAVEGVSRVNPLGRFATTKLAGGALSAPRLSPATTWGRRHENWPSLFLHPDLD